MDQMASWRRLASQGMGPSHCTWAEQTTRPMLPTNTRAFSHLTASDLEHCWFFSLMAFGVKLGHRPADLEGVCSHNQTSFMIMLNS